MIHAASKPDSLPVPAADAAEHSRRLRARIATAIDEAGGWLPFDRYMALALYAPGLGYYSAGAAKFGRWAHDGSDFVTAPELTPLFARTLARQVAQVLAATGTADVLEFGAGSGRLAADLLLELERLGTPCERYAILDLSGELRARQRATLQARAPALADRVTWLDALPPTFAGAIVGNEVLDAMPVRLHVRRGDRWLERGVALDTRDGANFVFAERATEMPPPEALRDIPADEGYQTESHEAAQAFVRSAGALLARGALLLVDYGFPAREYYHAQRAQGTLMCHYRHHAHGDPFFWPGLQDITTHVDFSGIAHAGGQAGLDLLGYTSQARFLMNCGLTDLLGELDASDPMAFLPVANAVQKLVSEAEMGELFKVIALGKGMDEPLLGFAAGDRSATL